MLRRGKDGSRQAHSPNVVETLYSRRDKDLSTTGLHLALNSQPVRILNCPSTNSEAFYNHRVRNLLTESLVSSDTCKWFHSMAIPGPCQDTEYPLPPFNLNSRMIGDKSGIPKFVTVNNQVVLSMHAFQTCRPSHLKEWFFDSRLSQPTPGPTTLSLYKSSHTSLVNLLLD